MTTQKTFKRRVRARAAKTGESFTAARAQLLARADRGIAAATPAPVAPAPSEPAIEMPTADEALVRATGQGYARWHEILDGRDATTRPHRENTRFLVEEHGVDGWWAQAITVGYERARGLRAVNQRPGAGFYLGANVTVNVPLARLSAAFLDDAERSSWLPAGLISLRRAGKSSSFDWADPPSRVTLWLVDKGGAKSQASIEHARLPDAAAVAKMRAFWKARFKELKARLEG
ncbi:MAG: hypothetical protein L0221_03385 [Chloroflexi bacterium]|nr:hypothetical protein [Chloroflexota bacterium]